jgi:hypothetical protein
MTLGTEEDEALDLSSDRLLMMIKIKADGMDGVCGIGESEKEMHTF